MGGCDSSNNNSKLNNKKPFISGSPNTSSTPQISSGYAGKSQPALKIKSKGPGISPNEEKVIVSAAMSVYQNGITPRADETCDRISQTLGGFWFVLVYPLGKPVDFNITRVHGNQYMHFTLDDLAYQICRGG